MARHGPRVVAAAEGEELHEEPFVGALRLAVPDAPLFAEVGGLDSGASRWPRGFGWYLGHTVPTIASEITESQRNTMSTNPDPRKAAEESLQTLVAAVQAQPPSDTQEAVLAECTALAVAIRAFHMEAIRFRMFNVDRAIARGTLTLTDDARASFADVRRHLEAAGFHTRSHQAPG